MVKRVWVRKDEPKFLVIHSSRWYLDSGCSRHMSGGRKLFAQLEKTQGWYVTFKDGNTAKILGVGTIVASDILQLTKALYVQGLKHNLVSISQICEKDYRVQYGNEGYVIMDHKKGNILVKGVRTSDNCYVIDPHPEEGDTCLICKRMRSIFGIKD